MLAHARQCVPRWLAQVDRVPPAELFETILAESAYAYELRGPRLRQARENVKKMRSLVRRIQNHGYATMPRIADHLDSLTAGDESNAVLEALDAVNLMTVHASKGLEFPIVFVVNMAKGASGPPRPVRVVVDADAEGDEQASVTVGPFVSEVDEAERQREKHETKRLLYVALTRARDRLYLASALKDGDHGSRSREPRRGIPAIDSGPLCEGRGVDRRSCRACRLEERLGGELRVACLRGRSCDGSSGVLSGAEGCHLCHLLFVQCHGCDRGLSVKDKSTWRSNLSA